MKTIEERVDDYLVKYVKEWNRSQERGLIDLLKEQDRITHHACAEAVEGAEILNACCITVRDRCHDACMNVKTD